MTNAQIIETLKENNCLFFNPSELPADIQLTLVSKKTEPKSIYAILGVPEDTFYVVMEQNGSFFRGFKLQANTGVVGYAENVENYNNL